MPKGSAAGGGTSTSGIISWLQRNSATDSAGTPRDAWHRYLVHIVGSDGTTADMEIKWLQKRITALSGTFQAGATSADLWANYLCLKGFTGTPADQFNAWIDHGTP